MDLLDWSQVEQAELLFADMTDPNTGEPIVINPNMLIGSPAKMAYDQPHYQCH